MSHIVPALSQVINSKKVVLKKMMIMTGKSKLLQSGNLLKIRWDHSNQYVCLSSGHLSDLFMSLWNSLQSLKNLFQSNNQQIMQVMTGMTMMMITMIHHPHLCQLRGRDLELPSRPLHHGQAVVLMMQADSLESSLQHQTHLRITQMRRILHGKHMLRHVHLQLWMSQHKIFFSSR